MSATHRVVVVRSDGPGFHGASGLYPSLGLAKGELLDIARSWVGLAQRLQLNHDGSFVVTYAGVTHTYSILSEAARPAFENTPFGLETAS